jgi:hypothetical protein
VFCFSSSCGSYVASFSVLSISIAPSVFSNVYLLHEYLIHCYRYKEKIEKRRISKWSWRRDLSCIIITLYNMLLKTIHILQCMFTTWFKHGGLQWQEIWWFSYMLLLTCCNVVCNRCDSIDLLRFKINMTKTYTTLCKRYNVKFA